MTRNRKRRLSRRPRKLHGATPNPFSGCQILHVPFEGNAVIPPGPCAFTGGRKEGPNVRAPAGIPICDKVRSNVPVSKKNYINPWKIMISKTSLSCARIFPSVALCLKHWSGRCSNLLAKKCPGCKLLNKAEAKNSWKVNGKSSKCVLIRLRVKRQACAFRACSKDPDKVPDIARRAYIMQDHFPSSFALVAQTGPRFLH